MISIISNTQNIFGPVSVPIFGSYVSSRDAYFFQFLPTAIRLFQIQLPRFQRLQTQ